MRSLLLLYALWLLLLCVVPADAGWFGVARVATPVLNSPEFAAIFGGVDGTTLKTDRCGQVRELEFIALPGSVFTIVKKLNSGSADIYQVETTEYTASPQIRLYVDGRFLELTGDAPSVRKRTLPKRGEIVAQLKGAVGNSYVWGGNVPGGVPELAELYFKNFSAGQLGTVTLSGLDCSGLLYHATGGWTPRNTSQLVAIGRGVDISGKGVDQIVSQLQPLDLIVWNGHVLIVLDQHTIIESRLECGTPGNGGVIMTPLRQRLAEIMGKRRPVNAIPERKGSESFVIRRWYGFT